ncbi:hypothetical protein TUMSATVNIG1_12010 [Vibrio nigripulchritudo]|uniref:hypothetical protein n=1 Tax=Vibrio nigripulchritudo TaxID=28173 RepID=UPI00190CCB40|nr:hypothetical protein [Vibrio nigripulchritudo]BCL69258.1 hypothetical protein VNTUMSATTG_11950 [Vibrio nigripulchritudo]BDU30592.1 hypothetical protein TUMSATVNIG1_12010 [Vibrio nigripulchritudo]
MNRILLGTSLLAATISIISTAQANSILYDSCERNSHASTSVNCEDESKASNDFEYEGSIWESDDSDEPLITFVDRGRSPDDKEWEIMNIEDKVQNEKRNECANRSYGECIIYEND